MAKVRSTSETDPADSETPGSGTVLVAYRLAERARLLGLMAHPALPTTPAATARFGKELAAKLTVAGVGRPDATDLDRLLAAVDANPLPQHEWPPLRGLLGDELLGRLLGISQSSLTRYAGGSRPTPDVVAARLHVLAMVSADLLGPQWDPDGPAAVHVRELAASVLSIGAT